MLSVWTSLQFCHLVKIETFSKQQILDSSKLKEFADNNSKFYENGSKLYKRVENTVRKGEIAPYEQFLLFPQRLQVFFCTQVKIRACLAS